MKIYVGVSYGREGETAVAGVAVTDREAGSAIGALRGESVKLCQREQRGNYIPVDDLTGDLIGSVLAFDIESPHEALLRRMLNPEDMGRAVPGHVRDEIRVVLGMDRCESTAGRWSVTNGK